MTIHSETYSSFNRWLIFCGLLAFGCFLAYQQDWITALIKSDRSHLSAVILGFFILATGHVGLLARRLGKQASYTAQLAHRARSSKALFSSLETSDILIDGETPQTSLAHEHLAFLAEKYRAFGQISGQDLLLDRLDNRIRRGHETGWFIADLMVRLGLLGTVIGFIFMLSSITTVNSVDLQVIQQMLSDMSGGMRIALYTTLTGLSAGILLSFQYQLLDQGADRLLADIIELSEVHAIQQLLQFAQRTDLE